MFVYDNKFCELYFLIEKNNNEYEKKGLYLPFTFCELPSDMFSNLTYISNSEKIFACAYEFQTIKCFYENKT